MAGGGGLVDQYTEQVPTASGPTHGGGGGGGGGGGSSTPLPAALQTQIQTRGGSEAKTLKKIATSPQYGAPTIHQPDKGTFVPASAPNPMSAAVSAVSDGSNVRLIGLFVALLATAALMLGAAAGRRGRRARF